MARRPIPDEDDVSLFPFLSIIAAIIGVLTLMIAAVTINQLNQEDVKEAVENSIEMGDLEKKLVVYTGEIEKLKLKLGAEEAEILKKKTERQQELVKTEAELNRLIEELKMVQEEAERDKQIKIVIPEIPKEQRETIADMQTQLALVKERLAVLQKELEKREEPPEEAEVSILPGGSGLSFIPRFVECSADSLVLHTEAEPVRMRRGEAAANPLFVKLLEEVANNQNMTIVFLVRDDGVDTFNFLSKICNDNEVRNGKLPVIGSGKLDFSHFNQNR
jgi:hypothetical protein